MKKKLFITGGGGFIGSNLLEKIDFNQYENIFCLGRRENDVTRRFSKHSNFTFIQGDICDPESYAGYLKLADTVVHLAALTGKAPKDDYYRINSEGTRMLLDRCIESGISNFIFISSVAADFVNVEGYYYAQSKIEAEQLVKMSGIAFSILRPTMVIGRHSAILDSLLKLAKAPVVPIFGDGRARIQPVYIDDLVGCILHVIEDSTSRGQTITVGGADIVSLEEFIRVLHEQACKKKFRVIHLPVAPIRSLLLKLEKGYLTYLPFTAGQLASFTNDGVADRDLCVGSDGVTRKNIDEMISLSLIPDEKSGRTSEDLKKECSVLTHYLIGREPDKYIQNKYLRAHDVAGYDSDADLFNTTMIKAANKSAFLLKLADAYTSVFYKNAVLRKKLLLVLAILECCDSTYREVDKGNEGPVSGMLALLGIRISLFLFTLGAGFVVFTPFKIITSLTTGTKKLSDYE